MMKFNLKNIAYITILSFAFISCGDIKPKGDIVMERKSIPDFKKMNLAGNFRAFFVKSDSSYIEIETYNNIYKNLSIESGGDLLTINEKRKPVDVDFYNITIYAPNSPSHVSLAKNVEMTFSYPLRMDSLSVILQDQTKFLGNIKSRTASVDLSTLARANFSGETQKAYIKAIDTTSVIAPYWMLETLTVDAENQPYIEVSVKDSIKGNIKNTSKLVYYNSPLIVAKKERKATLKQDSLQ